MVRDMTKGSPTRLILAFALPMLAGSILQQFYNLVDSIVVSWGVGVNAFASIGCTSSMNFFVIGFITGLTQGFSILISQYFGAKNMEGMRKSIAMSVCLSAVSVVVVSLAAALSSEGILTLMQTPDIYMEDAVLYSRIVYGCVGCLVFYNMTSSILRAVGDSRNPLVAIILSTIMNIGLDLLFVMVFHWGVAGAAIATAISQVMAMCYNLVVMRRLVILHLSRTDFRLDFAMMRKMLVMGIPMAFQNSVTALGVMILQGVVNSLGALYSAAYAAGCRVVNIIQQPNATFGMAMTTFSGQNLGAGKLDRIRKGVLRCIGINLIICTGLCLCMIFFSKPIAGLIVGFGETEIIQEASNYMVFLSLFLWVLGLLWPYRSALQGMGRTVMPMLSGGLELAIRISLVLTLPLFMGFWGVMTAEVSAWAGATIMLVIDYYLVIHKLKNSANLNQGLLKKQKEPEKISVTASEHS